MNVNNLIKNLNTLEAVILYSDMINLLSTYTQAAFNIGSLILTSI